MLALALPVATALRHSLSIWDIAVWGAIAVVLQLATFGVVNLILRGVSPAIEAGQTAAAVKLAARAALDRRDHRRGDRRLGRLIRCRSGAGGGAGGPTGWAGSPRPSSSFSWSPS